MNAHRNHIHIEVIRRPYEGTTFVRIVRGAGITVARGNGKSVAEALSMARKHFRAVRGR
jgi:hypothetical protein